MSMQDFDVFFALLGFECLIVHDIMSSCRKTRGMAQLSHFGFTRKEFYHLVSFLQVFPLW